MNDFNRVIGTGGIGTGLFFVTDNNQTLGRSESRLVTLTDAKDYCKLHIVFHYIARMLSPKKQVLPIGCVGKDAQGASLIEEMQQSGMDTTYVAASPDLPTPISICLQYPDKEGCNFTAANGAGQEVTPAFIEDALQKIAPDKKTIVMAIPEVSLKSRETLLKIGRRNGCFNILSFVVQEAAYVKEHDWLSIADLVSVNEEEAAALLKLLSPCRQDLPLTLSTEKDLIEDLFSYASTLNPSITLIMTVGRDGAFVCNSQGIEHLPPFPANVVNTTGAGDAFIGGTTAALAMGYPLMKGHSDETFGASLLTSAPEFGSLCAGLAVEEADSIALGVTPENILKRLRNMGLTQDFDRLL